MSPSLPLHWHHRPRVLALHVLLEPGAVGVGVGAQSALVPLVPRVVPPVPVPLQAVLAAGEKGSHMTSRLRGWGLSQDVG